MSQIYWIVRNDASHSDILVQASDQTWAAYNDYGGHSLYGGAGTWDLDNRAFKVSYNRPSDTRNFEAATFLFSAEYPMIMWLESNGYDLSYFTGVDAVRNASLITNHKLYLSVGHDEYVSAQARASIQAARDAGVNLGYFSGNEVFWKTRWENSIDGTNTPYRTMVCYKETYYGTSTLYMRDPLDPTTWTGTWADSRFSPPDDAGQPQNALTGTLFAVNGPGSDNSNLSIEVTADDGKMRFWRNTSIANLASGQTATLPAGTLGYEWDADIDNGFRPPGAITLSTSTYTLTTDLLLDFGGTYGAGNATHHLVLYRAASGALVFGAGTVQWSWGLDDSGDGSGGDTADIRMQQATVNLFADMGIQPTTLQSGLVPATKSTDTTAPTAVISSPAAGASVAYGHAITITGTASDAGGGVVGAVEVSVDGGQTWHPATGRSQWSYSWSPWGLSGTASIMARAIDDSLNIQSSPATTTINVTGIPGCPCSIWSNSATPGTPTTTDNSSIEVGLRFSSDVAGYVTGVRFYKGTNNTGTHIGNLWTANGTRLATVTFTNETATGWQQASFSPPVLISAKTSYVISYYAPNGGYADDEPYFTSSVDSPPLHALPDQGYGGNGLYLYASGGGFPAGTFNSANYWVDLVFVPATPWNISGTISGGAGASVSLAGPTSGTVTADGSGNYNFIGVLNGSYTVTPSNPDFTFTPSTQNVTVANASVSGVNFTATILPTYTLSGSVAGLAGVTITLTGSSSATATTNASGAYSFTMPNGTYTITPSLNGYIFTPASQTVTIAGAAITGINFTPIQVFSIWPVSATPVTQSAEDASSVELGVKFQSSVAGSVLGIRFYKGSANTGTHVGNLWSSTGTNMASATFTGETATGWQQVLFASPVAISANATYIASYFAPAGGYAADANFFSSAVSNPPLQALADSVSVNGVYAYGSASIFPSSSYDSTNYWVDVVFSPTATYSISGTITGGAGTTVTLTGATTDTVTADASGNYTFTGFPNGSYTVTPSKIGLTFSPTRQSVTVNGANVAAVNFTATTVPTFSISGTITGGAGVTVNLTGAATATVTADASGNYTFNGFPNGSYTVTPSETGLTFSPTSQSVTVNGANLTGVNFTATIVPTFSISGTITGGAGVTINLTGAATASVTANSSGAYTFSGLLNGTYTVTPAGSGLLISPASQTVTIGGANQAGVNFSAVQVDSIWPASAMPATASASDTSSVELGVKFQSSVAGSVLGIRFYKGSANTGTHVGNLWSSTGTNMASATFTGETATGWQQVLFASPVAISANATYIASYFAPAGGYAADANFFSSAVSNPPLQALADSVSVNGVYAYGSASIFPSSSYNSTNYWVDVVFSPAPTYSIAGSITGGAGSTVNLTGAATASVTADSSGNYTFTDLANGSYTVTPSQTGLVFSPTSRAVTVNGANLTGVNFTASAAPTFSITGTITGGAGSTVTLAGAASATQTANASGAYTFANLLAGSYTVTPGKTGLTFSPANRSVTITNANVGNVNFTATVVPTFSVSGTITGGAGATVSLTGAATTTTTANSSGAYTFSGLVNGSYTVTPSLAGTTFSPASTTVSVSSSNVANVNFTANPPLARDVQVSNDQATPSTSVVTSAFSTTAASELLLAFVSADQVSSSATTVTGITGAGLTWTLVQRTNTQGGDAEIWRAFASSKLTNATVKATLSHSVVSSMTVMSFKNVDTSGTNGSGAIGATASGNAVSGGPTAQLITTRNASWVVGVGNDFNSATGRTLGSGQSLIHQYLATSTGDTYWVQQNTSAIPVSGTTVIINDTAPTADSYNLSICEVLPIP